MYGGGDAEVGGWMEGYLIDFRIFLQKGLRSRFPIYLLWLQTVGPLVIYADLCQETHDLLHAVFPDDVSCGEY